MKKIGDLEKSAKKALVSCLSRVPFLKIRTIEGKASRGGTDPDYVLKVAFPEGEKHLVVKIKENGQPRLAREAVNQLLRYQTLFPDSYGVFVAPYIASKAGDICRQYGIGYLDLAGNGCLCWSFHYELPFLSRMVTPVSQDTMPATPRHSLKPDHVPVR